MRHTVKETPLETMLTVRQVADFLHVSICTVRRWSNKGMLKFYRVGSRGDRRYRREDVLRFLEESSRDSIMKHRRQKSLIG
jgi:excisionase family DNA binding protein